MDWSQFFAVLIIFSILWVIAQRLSQRHQRTFRIFTILLALGWLGLRSHLIFWEIVLGIVASLFMSFMFWVLIGRYNPVSNDDDAIKVYGLDD